MAVETVDKIIKTAGTNRGGGGGGGTSGVSGRPGGSGIVIVKLPTAYFSGTTTGSPTQSTQGDFTVLKYTGSGSIKA